MLSPTSHSQRGVVKKAKISFTPVTAATNSYYLIIRARNTYGVDEKRLSIDIGNEGPVITTEELKKGSFDIPHIYYYDKLVATGNGPIRWELSEGRLPDGLFLGEWTGEISGDPIMPGVFEFKIIASNDISYNWKVLSIEIYDKPAPPVIPPELGNLLITTTSLPSGERGKPYREIIRSNESRDMVVTWYISNLPNNSGLSYFSSLDENGYHIAVVSGTPTISFDSQLRVTVSDDSSPDRRTHTRSVDLKIVSVEPKPYPPKLEISEDNLPVGAEFILYPTVQINLLSGDQSIHPSSSDNRDLVWSFVGEMPPGLSFDKGKISGIPSASRERSFDFIVIVRDDKTKEVDIKDFSIFIRPAERPTIITKSASLDKGVVGARYSQTLEATGDQPITWLITSGDLKGFGLSFDETRERFTAYNY